MTIGTDMADYTAARIGRTTESFFATMRPTPRANYRGFERHVIPLGRFLGAIARDKKNRDAQLSLILPNVEGRVGPVRWPNEETFHTVCADYMAYQRCQ